MKAECDDDKDNGTLEPAGIGVDAFRSEVPLIMHIVFRFGVGGLENGIVNLINRLPRREFRHCIVSLTSIDPVFSGRIKRADVRFVALGKGPGHGWRVFFKMWRLLRDYRPLIVHTRNLAALEMQLPAWAAGVPIRIHGEHGRDSSDPDGSNFRYRLERRMYRPFVTQYVAVSRDLEQYLTDAIGIPLTVITRICNGVDLARFRPVADSGRSKRGISGSEPLVVAAVGRLDAIKGHSVLVKAVELLVRDEPWRREQFRVFIVGDGPCRASLESQIEESGIGSIFTMLGERKDIAELMGIANIFVLPSLAEGISNTVLEAMACALPVVATSVGGNLELIESGETGTLVPPADPRKLARAIAVLLDDAELCQAYGQRARERARLNFSLEAMVGQYRKLYLRALDSVSPSAKAGT